MNQLTVRFAPGLSGRAKGTAANASLSSLIQSTALQILGLSSTGTDGGFGNQGFGPQARPLGPAAAENIDWRNFLNTLQESGQQFATAIRFFYVFHSPGSLASTITVGNGGTGEWLPFGWPAGTAMKFKPKEGIILVAPTATGLPVDAARHVLKVLNDDAGQIATYEAGAFGV